MNRDPDSPETIRFEKAWEAAMERAEDELREQCNGAASERLHDELHDGEDVLELAERLFESVTDDMIEERAHEILEAQADDYREED